MFFIDVVTDEPTDFIPWECPQSSIPGYGVHFLEYDYDRLAQIRWPEGTSWDRFIDFLPFQTVRMNFGEYTTPLLKAQKLGEVFRLNNLFIKDESRNPTGSFKDRQAYALTNIALEAGKRRLLIASSGNGAISTAAYAHRAGLECCCIIPKRTSVGKRMLLQLHGAGLEASSEDYEASHLELLETKETGWNVTSGCNPYVEEGVKLIAYEIWEQMGVPDAVVCCCGNGSLLAGLYKGFYELKQMNRSSTLPALYGVQIEGAAPLDEALKANKPYVALPNCTDSIAEAIVAKESFSAPRALHALRKSHGTMITVSDSDIAGAIQALIGTENIIPEPSAAAAFAGLTKARFAPSDKVVVLNSASGMKNFTQVIELLLNQ